MNDKKSKREEVEEEEKEVEYYDSSLEEDTESRGADDALQDLDLE